MKKYKFIIFFVSTILMWVIFYTILHWPALVFAEITLLIFSTYQFIRFILDVFYKNYTLAVLSLLTSLLIFALFLKIQFTYYNIFVHLLIIILSITFYLKFKNVNTIKKCNAILMPFLLLNILLILVGDLRIYHFRYTYFHPKNIPYSEIGQISWKDFKGEIQNDTNIIAGVKKEADAAISSGPRYNYNIVYSYPQIVSLSQMDPNISYTNNYGTNLLKHELLHFCVSELFSQKINKLNNLWPIPTPCCVP